MFGQFDSFGGFALSAAAVHGYPAPVMGKFASAHVPSTAIARWETSLRSRVSVVRRISWVVVIVAFLPVLAPGRSVHGHRLEAPLRAMTLGLSSSTAWRSRMLLGE